MSDRLFPPNTDAQVDPQNPVNNLGNQAEEEADRLRFAAMHVLRDPNRITTKKSVTITSLKDRAGGLHYDVSRQVGDKLLINFGILGLGNNVNLPSQYGLKPGIAAVNVEIDDRGWRIASLTKYGENEPIPVVDQSEALLSDQTVGQSFFEQLTHVLSQDPADLSPNQQIAA